MLPLSYFSSFLKYLKALDGVEFLTYADLFEDFLYGNLPTSADSTRRLFALEELCFLAKQRTSASPTAKVLLMHDCDSGPNELLEILDLEAQLNIPSTVSLFARVLGTDGLQQEYDIDFKSLLKHSGRVCFSYHCNAAELSGYRNEVIYDQFDSDVTYLEDRGFDLDFFSPHGGRPSSDGRNNRSFFYPKFSKKKLLWTHNGYAPHGPRYSDGGLASRLRHGDETLDLRNFLQKNLKRSQRVFLLLHPQYYSDRKVTFERSILSKNPWLDEFLEFDRKGDPIRFWISSQESV